MPGRKKTPTATIRLREGIVRKKYGDRSAEPAPEVTAPECPIELTGLAKMTWDRLVPVLLESGCLTVNDAESLAMACKTFATAVNPRAKASDRREAVKEWRVFSAMFGLSPADRTKIAVDKRALRGKTGTRDRAKDKKAS